MSDVRRRFDTVPDDVTDPSIGIDGEPTDEINVRELPTAPAEPRTAKMADRAPWLAAPEPLPRESKPRDPLFWPVAVFVAVVIAAIGITLISGNGHPGAHVQSSSH